MELTMFNCGDKLSLILKESTMDWKEVGKVVFFGIVVPVAVQVASQLAAAWAEEATRKSKNPININL